MAEVKIDHMLIHKLESKTVKYKENNKLIEKLCAGVAGMEIVGNKQDLYYLKAHTKDDDESEEKQPMVLSRIQNWISGDDKLTHKEIKNSKGDLVKAKHANGLTYYRKQGASTGLFFIATRNELKDDPKSEKKFIGPQVIAVTKDGIVKKEIYYTAVINSIACYDTHGKSPRFLIGIGVNKPRDNSSDWIEYKYHLVELVGNTFHPLVQYNAPRINGYRFGNDIYYNDKTLYVTVFKKGTSGKTVEENRIIPFDLSSYDITDAEASPPIYTIKNKARRELLDKKKDTEKSYEIEGMAIHTNGKKYVCTNRSNPDGNKKGDWVCQLYKKNK